MEKNTRHSYLVNPTFQFRMIGWMLGTALAPICVFFAAHFYFFRKLKMLGEGIHLENNHIYFRFLEAQSQNMFLIFILCSILTVLIVFICGLILSNRVAGPIHRLKNYLQEASVKPDSPELTFRKNDYFSELPSCVNTFVKSQKK